ncbi:MAG: hypothetical protein IIC76_06685 [Bacteroidetes bacterium]|nr:hypothetical protein [Bacteroidota bacterium]
MATRLTLDHPDFIGTGSSIGTPSEEPWRDNIKNKRILMWGRFPKTN